MHYIISEGELSNGLSFSSDDETIEHLRNHLGNFLLDTTACAAYAKILGTIPLVQCTESVHDWTRYLLNKFAKHASMNGPIMGYCSRGHDKYFANMSKSRPPENAAHWLARALWLRPQRR